MNNAMRKMVAEHRFTVARSVLHHSILELATRLAERQGFWWVATPDAPSTFGEVCAEYRKSKQHKLPFPVYNGGMEQTVYLSDTGNLAFRFWHDLKHYFADADFSYDGEVTAAALGRIELRDYLEYKELNQQVIDDVLRLYDIDTVGQLDYYHSTGGKFVDNQLEFAFDKFLVDFV